MYVYLPRRVPAVRGEWVGYGVWGVRCECVPASVRCYNRCSYSYSYSYVPHIAHSSQLTFNYATVAVVEPPESTEKKM